MILCLSGAAVAMKSQAITPLRLKQEFNTEEHISMEYKQRSTYLGVHLQKFCIASISVLGLKCIKLHRGGEREREKQRHGGTHRFTLHASIHLSVLIKRARSHSS